MNKHLKVKTVIYVIFTSITCLSIKNIIPKDSSAQIQQLHKKISDDLLSLRKEYPKTQSTIYPLLDQVGQLYKISRNAIVKEKTYKQKIDSNQSELTKLYQENNELKLKMTNIQSTNEEKQKEFDHLNNKLKKRKIHLAMLAKEREDLNKKVNQFEEQQLQQLEKSEEVKNQKSSETKKTEQEITTEEKQIEEQNKQEETN